MHTTPTLSCTSPNFVHPNWVCAFAPLGVPLSLLMFCSGVWLHSILVVSASSGDSECPHWCSSAGQLVWRRHGGPQPPSPQVVRNLCMQLLPLLEMYCRWELQDDCGDLLALMHCFDSETDLESHELGRSLLFMIRNDDAGMVGLPRHARNSPIANPFDAIRERLATVDMAIRSLNVQVHIFLIPPPCGANTVM